MKVTITEQNGTAPYEIDTIDVADRLNALLDRIAMIDLCVEGLIYSPSLGWDEALGGMRMGLRDVSDELAAVSEAIHPDRPAAAPDQEAA